MIKYFLLLSVMSIFLFACGNNHNKQETASNDSPEMVQYKKDQRNKAIALQCIRAYAAHDSEFIIAHNATDVVNIYNDKPPTHGLDSIRIDLREAFDIIKEYKPSNELALADSNYVFIFLYVDGSLRNNPKTTHDKMVEIFKFNDDGKIIEHFAVDEESDSTRVKRSL